jgi:hypothetical protein
MIGEIFAYYYGKSRGREDARREGQRKPLTRNEAAQEELAYLIILCCIGAVLAVVVFGVIL